MSRGFPDPPDVQMQKQPPEPIEFHGDDPDAIEEMLKYLYTLSDHLKVLNLDNPHDSPDPYPPNDTPGMSEVKLLEEMAYELKHLANVLTVAGKYCVSDLVTLAGQKIKERLSRLRYRIKFGGGGFDDTQVSTLLFAWSEALYPEDEILELQEYQKSFAVIIVDNCSIATGFVDIKELISSYPKLGWDLLNCTDEVVTERDKRIGCLQGKIDSMRKELPKSKRKYF